MTQIQQDKGYQDFYKYQLTWSPYFHYGLFKDTDDLEKAQERAIDEFCALGGIDAGSRVLDVGCGIGSTAIYIASRHRCQVSGIDPEQTQIEHARQRVEREKLEGLISVEVGRAESIPAISDHFDVILMNEVLCLVNDKSSALMDVRRVLKPGGRLVISDLYDSVGGSGTAFFHRSMRHVTPMLRPEEFISLIKASRFKIDKMIDRKADVAESYRAAIKRLNRLESSIVKEFGNDQIEVIHGFYHHCLSEPVKRAIGWAIYSARKDEPTQSGCSSI